MKLPTPLTSVLTKTSAVLLTCGLIFSVTAQAQSKWPDKTVRMIVPAPPGSAPDGQVRLIGQKLSETWSQPVVIENVVGAAGNIGTDRVAKAAPDGYTFLYNTIGPIAVNPTLMAGKMPYDVEKDLIPVSLATKTPNFITVHPSVPANNMQELIALAKTKPGVLNYGSSGTGGVSHLAGELFDADHLIKMTHVPYKGTAEAGAALLGGQIDFAFVDNTIRALMKAGKIRALAVTSGKRWQVLPDVPTLQESIGMSGASTRNYYLLPAGAPMPLVNQINAAIVKALRSTDLEEKVTANGYVIVASSPEEGARYYQAEYQAYEKVVKDIGLKIE